MVIEPTGGLANRLRCVFSYVKEARVKGESLKVIWKFGDACPGHFQDLFNPIDNIEFLKTNCDHLPIDYKGCYKHPVYDPDYSLLKPNIEIQSVVTDRLNKLGNFCSVHIRRTDHIELAKRANKWTQDSLFIDFINYHHHLPIYISTDNPQTWQEFKNLYCDRVVFDWWSPRNALRQSSLREAVIDLWVCKGANEFLGSGWSSFTDLILDLRGDRFV